MENNFIQMAASAGDAVVYTIVTIFKHIILCSCISPMASWILSSKASIAAPRWPNDISYAVDNAIFKNRAQKIECSFGCVARSAVLLKPHVANILLFNFCEHKFVQHGPIRSPLTEQPLFAYFRRKMAQLWFWIKIRTKQWLVLGASAFQCRRAGFLCPKFDNFVCLHARQDQISFIWKDDFFFLPKSMSGPLPSVVQVYTQPYSFGRIKLIFFQIRFPFMK